MIGCFSLARETFDIEFAKKKIAKAKRIIKKLNDNLVFFDDLIANDQIGEKAIEYFANIKCTKFIVIQSTFTDAKFISSFVKKFKKPILFISFQEKRTGERLRLNSLCGVNLGLHALIKNKFYSNFIIYKNDNEFFSKEILKFLKNNNYISKNNYLKRIINSKKHNKLISYKQPKIGLIGERPVGFDTCDYNKEELKSKFNVKIKKINLQNLFKISSKVGIKHINNSKKHNKLISYKQPKIGLIGERPIGFDTCEYNREELKSKFNAKIKKINLQNLFKISSKVGIKQIKNTKKNISADLKNLNDLDQKELNKSLSLFHGLQQIQQTQNINAFAVRCWPEMFTEYGCASCGPMAMMNESKISSACEADVLGSLSCNILNQLNNKPALLVDIVDVDEKDNTTVFWHCGLAPISMAEKNTPSATVHSNRRKPLLHNFAFKSGEITIFRVSKSENKLKFILMKGKVLKRKNSFSGTSGVIRLGQNTFKKIKNLFLSGLEHHVCFTYGDVIEDIKTLGKQLKIPTYTI